MGNVLPPQNALSARPPVSSPAAGGESTTAEALGWQLRAALPPLRLHSVSIYDSQGNVLWLSEGALGPDEHSLVLEALETLTGAASKHCCENKLEDGRIAAFLAVRAPQGHLVGLAMILADLKSGGEGLMDRIMSAPTRTVMQKLAVLLRPAGPRKPDADPTALVLSLAPADMPAAAPEPPPVAAPAPARTRSAAKTDDELSPRAVNDILEFELTDAPILTPARQAAAVTGSSPALPPTAASAAAPASASVSAPAQPAAISNGRSRTNGHASPADSDTSQALKRPAPADTSTARAAAQPADTGTARAAAQPAPADTASGRALKQSSPADTGSARNLASPASTGAARALALDPALVTLEMLPFVKLRSGGRTRRFEVLPAGTSRELRDPAVLDSLAMQRLLAWLGNHRAAWTVEPASFTLNLSIATLEDDGFLKQVAAGLQSNGIAPDTVGFEIAEPLCTQRRAQVERFMAGCDKLGCFVVIDDFSFDSAVVPLLRSKALRLVKIDARLTSSALRDKLSQAMVVAVVQAVKVLGMHCAAQQVDSQAALQWLTAVGCDFAQGPMLARQQPLETLLGSAS
ncbi:MAG TPA: EAL domain-containing protein [Steroidobacteraceae bacterium]|nr:EAL domain-containing protein [Steroidobacteraceae bacterium]